MRKLRKLLVFFGYSPWRRCSLVAAWTSNNGRAAIMFCTRDGYEELYIKHGLKCQDALEFETKRLMELLDDGYKYIILERTTLPANRTDRDNWVVNFNRKCIEVK